jgi:adenylate kinase
MIVTLLGAPGAGKGTQAVGLAQALGVPHLSTGDILRANLRDHTPLGLEAEGFMNRGALVPDGLVIGMVKARLAEPDAAAGAVLDGFPRTVAQAEALDAMLSGLAVGLPRAVALDVPREALIGRLTGRRVCRANGHPYHVQFKPPSREGICDVDGSELYQRADDTVETVTNRLDVFDRETAPVIDYYRERERLVIVPADGGPDAVTTRLRAVFGL